MLGCRFPLTLPYLCEQSFLLTLLLYLFGKYPLGIICWALTDSKKRMTLSTYSVFSSYHVISVWCYGETREAKPDMLR